MGRLLRILLLIIAFIAGIAVLASIALFLFFDPNDFRDDISAAVREATGRELVIEGDLSLSMFPWIAVDVGRTRLGNAAGFGAEPFLSFEEARLSVRLMPLLFQQTVKVGTASLDSLSVNLEVAADGRNNWDDLTQATRQEPEEEAPETAGAEALDIASVRLSNATIALRDEQAGSANTISGLTLTTGSIAVSEPFDVDAEFDLGTEPAGISGHIQLAGTVILAEGNEQLGINDFRVAGQLDGVAAEATEVVLETPSIDIDLSAERIVMDEVQFALLGLDMSANVEPFSYADPKPTMSLRVETFSLKELMQTLGIKAPPTADPDALGRVTLSAKAIVGDKDLALRSMTLELDDTKLMGQLSLPMAEQGPYRFDLTADVINVDRYMAPADQGAGPAAVVEDEIEIPVDLVRSLNANGTLKLDLAHLSGMTFQNVAVGINSANGRLRMHPISAELYDGTYNGDIRIDAAGDAPSISVNERINGVKLAPLAVAMFEQENITGTIEGSFKLNGRGQTLSAIRRDLDGSMSFSLADGAWEGTDVWHQLRSARALFKQEPAPEPRSPVRTEFSNVRATGMITDGVFRNEDLFAELPFLRLTGSGTVDLAEAQIDYSMRARVLEQPEFIDSSNEAELADFTEAVIPLSITGPLAAPSIKPDIEAMLRAEVERAVEEKGEELKKRLLDRLIGGSGEPAADNATEVSGDEPAPDEEEDPEDLIEDALKKLLDN